MNDPITDNLTLEEIELMYQDIIEAGDAVYLSEKYCSYRYTDPYGNNFCICYYGTERFTGYSVTGKCSSLTGR